ncbi:MAG: DUF3267 domain-containing protein [Oscillospiraceae bacterium]|nr:DUF3267 domain-containing protein [Oscillospiraceae bacterium]
MKSFTELPEGYAEILHIDLQKDKKLMTIVNVLAVVISVAMILIAAFFVPLGRYFAFNMTQLLVLCVGFVAYMVLHELVHGITMRCFSEAKVKYGFTGMYAFAGSDAYYCRKHYVIIALAPIVVWGIVLGILNFLVPMNWFYVVYLIQVGNISGAAGDLYVSWRFCKLPEDILVRDTGVAMTVFSRKS